MIETASRVPLSIDKTWHLSNTEEAMNLTEFELQLWRVYFGFIRWQQQCQLATNKEELSADELAILHIVRMKDQPKTIADIGILLNRIDYFNINYTINKLVKKKLIEKEDPNSKKKQNRYVVTEAGRITTDAYSEARKSILQEFAQELSKINFEELTNGLMKMKSLYDEATRLVASYKPKES